MRRSRGGRAAGPQRCHCQDGVSSLASPGAGTVGGWQAVLLETRRDRLEPALRPFFDDLLIDALEEVGAFDELMTRLASVPRAERGPRVWQALGEVRTMARLARLSARRDPQTRASSGARPLG